MCRPHLDKAAGYMRERSAGLKAWGLCVRCSEPTGGAAYCREHARANVATVAASRSRHLAAGECGYCGAPNPKGTVRCPICTAQLSAAARARRAK